MPGILDLFNKQPTIAEMAAGMSEEEKVAMLAALQPATATPPPDNTPPPDQVTQTPPAQNPPESAPAQSTPSDQGQATPPAGGAEMMQISKDDLQKMMNEAALAAQPKASGAAPVSNQPGNVPSDVIRAEDYIKMTREDRMKVVNDPAHREALNKMVETEWRNSDNEAGNSASFRISR